MMQNTCEQGSSAPSGMFDQALQLQRTAAGPYGLLVLSSVLLPAITHVCMAYWLLLMRPIVAQGTQKGLTAVSPSPP